jgi:hypothetical protein
MIMNKFTAAANMSLFLLEKTGSVCGTFRGNLPAKQQREMFGEFLGKGKVTIDGKDETLSHTIKVCFGHDYDVTFDKKWKEL